MTYSSRRIVPFFKTRTLIVQFFFLTSDGSSFIIVKYLIYKLGLIYVSFVCECSVLYKKNARIVTIRDKVRKVIPF